MNKAPGVDAFGTKMLMELSEVISDMIAYYSISLLGQVRYLTIGN